jgi:LPXTG-site transpeptidase (sortase) family protein
VNQKDSNPVANGRRHTGVAGIAMIVVGLVLLGTVGAYYGYRSYADSQLDSLIFTPAESAPLVPVSTAPLPDTDKTFQALVRSNEFRSAVHVSPLSQPPADGNPPENAAFPVSSYASVYPATEIHPKYWAEPMWSGGEPYSYSPNESGPRLPEGFHAVSSTEGTQLPSSNTTRISVPSVGIDSNITELQILDLGNSRAYETPKNTVGHIPQSPNAGQLGNSWFFGHLESPIKGEGNVFQRLPDIPEKLRNGDEVLIELENEQGHIFLYRVTATDVVHQDDMRLYDSSNATITLVACVPSLVYDHRILVTADLIGIKEG